MNKNKYQIIKTIVFIIIGIIVIVFANTLTDYANILVGCLMLMYGIEDFIYKVCTSKINKHIPKIANDGLIVLLGIICLFLNSDERFVPLCIIWATWAILREEWEIEEIVVHFDSRFLEVINILESIAVVVICVIFIFNPTKEHVHLHIIILGFELILEVLFPMIDRLLKKKE